MSRGANGLLPSVPGYTADAEGVAQVHIAMVGKYTDLADAYLSVMKALQHACLAANRKLEVLSLQCCGLCMLCLPSGAVAQASLRSTISVPSGQQAQVDHCTAACISCCSILHGPPAALVADVLSYALAPDSPARLPHSVSASQELACHWATCVPRHLYACRRRKAKAIPMSFQRTCIFHS